MQLGDGISDHFRLSQTQQKALKALGLSTIEDLLFYVPFRYENISGAAKVSQVATGDTTTLYGRLSNLGTKKAFKKKTPMAEGILEDETGRIKVMWFNQPYIAKMVADGSLVKASGRISGSENSPYLSNPEIEVIDELPDTVDTLWSDGDANIETLYPIYPERRGITSKWFYHALQKVFQEGVHTRLEDPIPQDILQRYHLPSRATALVWIHAPQSEEDAAAARKRFAFEEVFLIQLIKNKQRKEIEESQAITVAIDPDGLKGFMDRFPFTATNAQQRAIDDILADFDRGTPMSRLLEGDVGSGKTAVAATTAYAVCTTHPYGDTPESAFGNLQVAYMAPTEILARQHFESFIEYFSHLPIQIGLITSSECRKFPSKVNAEESTHISRNQLLKWVANGEIAILIGTHSLIQKKVQFENLGYVIIDEQHRFGTGQRQRLVRKDDVVPHLLSMTATPIPRTLALTIYGDLDLTLLDEMPKGRKPIKTEIVPPAKRDNTYEAVRKELEAGRQAYVICPLIEKKQPGEDEPISQQKLQAMQSKAVTEEAARLQKEVFPEYDIDILHGKLKPTEKEAVMERFLNNESQILVATSVVEVGVNVPNATTIIIEGAERFGLAQLHQLRGRVIRSTHQAYCYVFTDSKAQKAHDRLKALKSAKTGFELAEYDLQLRGAGELYGKKQWGISDIGMEAIRNIKMVEAARNEAHEMIESDPQLQKHAHLAELVSKKEEQLHFE